MVGEEANREGRYCILLTYYWRVLITKYLNMATVGVAETLIARF
jgi:hypothetical protein